MGRRDPTMIPRKLAGTVYDKYRETAFRATDERTRRRMQFRCLECNTKTTVPVHPSDSGEIGYICEECEEITAMKSNSLV